MAFQTETNVLLALGYSLVTIKSNPKLFPDSVSTDPDSMLFCVSILNSLRALDLELAENTKDSMAVKVQDLGLDYRQYITQTLQRGCRLLEELSTAISVPIITNKYTGSVSRIAVRNYY